MTQNTARALLNVFGRNFPPCLLFHGPLGSGQKEMFHEFFDGLYAPGDLIEFDKPKIDELLPLQSWVIQKPELKYRVVLIDRLEEVSKEAANFLLKIVEDSLDQVRWVLIADSKDSVLEPMRSRSVLVPFVSFTSSVIPEAFGGNATLQASLVKLNLRLVESQLSEVINSKRYDKAHGFCNFLKRLCEESTKELEFLRDAYLYCCNVLMRHFQDDPEKLHYIQEAKNVIRENVRSEQSFKVMFLRVLT